MDSVTPNKLLLSDYFERRADVILAILFGSAAENSVNFESDIDIAVLTDTPLSAAKKEEMIDEIARVVERPVDLVDLHHAHGTLLRQILSKGTRLVWRNSEDFARLIKRAVYDQSDFQRYIDRIHEGRRKRWIGI
ncbi:MAG: nucleotidyltransferase domain-containing protein [Verrucomicrobia bacterium]|nr:nucleotidyltransferase domain-containing protein [Verrucomicrobiota bacterium]